jgi:hypothetical protein
MSEWVFCQDGFIETDVIRWEEPVWEQRGPRQGKSVIIGERLLTAEVLEEDEEGGWVKLLVRDCKVLKDKTNGRKNLTEKKDAQIRRQRRNVIKGRPERMLRDDESVRADLCSPGSRFPGEGRGS